MSGFPSLLKTMNLDFKNCPMFAFEKQDLSAINISPNVTIIGFSSRNPANFPLKFYTLRRFVEVCGVPLTNAEYSTWLTVKNAFEFGANEVTFYRIPYISNFKKYENWVGVNISSEEETVSIKQKTRKKTGKRKTKSLKSTNVKRLMEWYENNIYCKSLNFQPSSLPSIKALKNDFILEWERDEIGAENEIVYKFNDNLLKITIKNVVPTPITPKGTSSISVSKNVTYNENNCSTIHSDSLGVGAFIIGDANLYPFMDNTEISFTEFKKVINKGIKLFFKNNEHCVVLQDDSGKLCEPFGSLSIEIDEFIYQLYTNLVLIKGNNDSNEILSKPFNHLVVWELVYNSDKNTIVPTLLEIHSGSLGYGLNFYLDSLVNVVNTNSKFINLELTQNSDFLDKKLSNTSVYWSFFDMSQPFQCFGMFEDDNLYFNEKIKIFGKQIEPPQNTLEEFIKNRNFVVTEQNLQTNETKTDYLIFPSIFDFLKIEENESVSLVCPNNFDIFNTIENTYLPSFEMWESEFFNRFCTISRLLDRFSTVLVDIPFIFSSLNEENKQHFDTYFGSSFLSNSNIFVCYNYQLADSFSFEKDINNIDNYRNEISGKLTVPKSEYNIVPPSTFFVGGYLYTLRFKNFDDLSGVKTSPFCISSHGGIVEMNTSIDDCKTWVDYLKSNYNFNCIITDLNNRSYYTGELLQIPAYQTVFSQHHAFRLKRYIIENIIYLSKQGYIYEQFSYSLLNRFYNDLNNFLSNAKKQTPLENYELVCNESNNTSETIDNHEIRAEIKIWVFGSIMSLALNINSDTKDIFLVER